MKKVIEIETKRAGQPRPYADSVYEDILTFTDDRGKWTPRLEEVRKIAIGLYGDRVKEKSDVREFWEPYFEEIIQLSENSWRVIIIDPYKD